MISIMTVGPATILLAALLRHLAGERGRGVLLGAALTVMVVTGGGAAPVPGEVRSVSITVAVAILVASAPGRRTERSPNRAVPWTVALYGLSVAVTSVANPAALGAVIWLGAIAMLAVAAAGRCSSADIRAYRTAIVMLATIEAALGLVEFGITGHPLLWDYTDMAGALPNFLLPGDHARVAGTLAHPIVFALLMTVATVLTVRSRRVHPGARSLLVALFAVSLVLSGSRSAIVALAVGLAFLVLSSQRSKRALRVALAVILAAGGIFLNRAELSSALTTLVDSGSYTNRAGALDAAPGLLQRPFLECLFGSGFGSEAMLTARGYLNQNGFGIVDNQLVTTLATQGLVGLVVLVALAVVWIRHGDRTQRAIALAALTMYFSFDDLRWPVAMLLLLPVLAMPRRTAESPAKTAQTSPSIHLPKELAPCRTR